jgi:DNA-directed RNA polymerase subunit D
MQVKLISKNKEKTEYCFLIKSAEPYLLNAVRRGVVSMVPTMAIETVEIRKNSSVVYDEVIAHRLGLVPLKTDLKHYDMIKTPEDEESLKCTNKLSLKIKGPKTVYSKDLKSNDPAIVPVFDNMPLIKLTKGQEIALEATAILGTGKQHIKWSPGIVYYKHKPIITISNDANIDELKANIPDNSAIKINGNKASIDEELIYTTNYFDAFVGETIAPGVSVSMSEDEFVFNIESFGQLSVKEMLNESIVLLKKKLEEFDENIRNTKTE